MVRNRMYIKPRSSTLEEQTTFLTTLKNNRQFDLILLSEPLGSIKSITLSQSLKTRLRTCYIFLNLSTKRFICESDVTAAIKIIYTRTLTVQPTKWHLTMAPLHETPVPRVVPRRAKFKALPLARNKQRQNRVTLTRTLKPQLPARRAF